MRKSGESGGIKSIADALDISIGTVDRALHGRSGVSEKTKARVLAMAEQIGYKPNLAAQVLKLNRRLSIGVVLPRHISHFFDPVRKGIQAASDAVVGVQVNVEFHDYPRLGMGDAEEVERALEDHYDGLILLPGDSRKFDPLIRRHTRNGTAVLCVGSDAPGSERIGSVSAHAHVSGAIAAELLSHKIAKRANVAIFSGDLFTLDHSEKLRGFAATLAVQAPHLSLLPAFESHEQPKQAYRQAKALMLRKDRPEGLYLSTANSLPVLHALDELNLLGKVQIITTDLFSELVPLLEYGRVFATLHQRPLTQGKIAFENMLAHLFHSPAFRPAVRLTPHIVFRSNVSLFADEVASTDDESITGE